jgi:hypothetical protein
VNIFFKSLIFQDSNTLNIIKLTFYHDKALLVLISIRLIVAGGLILFSINKFFSYEYIEHQLVEFLWAIAFPSIKALYYLDEVMKRVFSVKIVGHQ